MKYLLDTCVLSELMKKSPNEDVVKWLLQIQENDLYICVFTLGEIHKGIEKLQESKKKSKLHTWVNNDLDSRFKNRILYFDPNAAIIWGKVQAQYETQGRPLPLIDGLIASIAIANDLILVTRNTKDMEASGVPLLNPWVSTK